MSTATTERTAATADADDVDRDGIEVYCPEAQTWSRTVHLFCETCGDTGHELR